MNLLAELLPDGLLQGTDRQASVITVSIPPRGSGAASLHIRTPEQSRAPGSEQSLGPDPVLAF